MYESMSDRASVWADLRYSDPFSHAFWCRFLRSAVAPQVPGSPSVTARNRIEGCQEYKHVATFVGNLRLATFDFAHRTVNPVYRGTSPFTNAASVRAWTSSIREYVIRYPY